MLKIRVKGTDREGFDTEIFKKKLKALSMLMIKDLTSTLGFI
jgi:hypothetical protein